MEVWILTVEIERFIPNKTMRSKMRPPVEFDEGVLPLGVDEAEGMNTEGPASFGMTEGSCDLREATTTHSDLFTDWRNGVPSAYAMTVGGSTRSPKHCHVRFGPEGSRCAAQV